MIVVLRRFIDICLLRAGPQDLPASRFLAIIALLMYSAVGLMLAIYNVALPRAVLVVAVDIGVLAGLLFLLLWIRDLLNRYLQAFTAFLGSGAILQAVILPVSLLQPNGAEEPVTAAMVVVSLLLWVWLLWGLLVVAHILRHSVSTTFSVGAMLGLLYMFVSFSVMRNLLISATA